MLLLLLRHCQINNHEVLPFKVLLIKVDLSVLSFSLSLINQSLKSLHLIIIRVSSSPDCGITELIELYQEDRVKYWSHWASYEHHIAEGIQEGVVIWTSHSEDYAEESDIEKLNNRQNPSLLSLIDPPQIAIVDKDGDGEDDYVRVQVHILVLHSVEIGGKTWEESRDGSNEVYATKSSMQIKLVWMNECTLDDLLYIVLDLEVSDIAI